ncbi:DUF916 domain-containing protein [Companilactobacillus mishanensis]|uniref:DUF916 domain-containing protein n=1 Tax=Companilactobacillus mishanensis TaxID=2486008 RepID=A0ABW9P8W6_9LACO|nr:DUF916 domain-containing protein [Companilactobacillus mishanensis]MQS45720.1 DUF916 domain-containing protein [Companilactobacillus mishanensis]
MRKFVFVLSLLLGLVTIFSVGNIANAAENKSYSIQAILPDTQQNKGVSYFDLHVEPGKEETLKLLIANTGKKDLTITTEINNAYTTNSGTIGYDKYNAKLYKSQNKPLSSLVEGKRKIKSEVKSGEAKEVSFKIKAPEESFSGIILGGITTTADVSASRSSKMDIENQVRYVKGVVLHSDNDAEVIPEMNLLRGAPKGFNDTKGISFAFNNTAPINVNGVKMDAVIKHRGSKPIKYHAENLQFAPNSQFEYFIPIKPLRPGVYSTELTITSDAGYKKTFTNKLKITQGKIEALNESTNESVSPIRWIVIIGSLLVILVVGLWFFLYFTGKKNGFKKQKNDKSLM